MGKKAKEEKCAMIIKMHGKFTMEQIAKKTGYTYTSVKAMVVELKRLGKIKGKSKIVRTTNGKYNVTIKKGHDIIAEMYGKNTIIEIMKATGYTYSTVNTLIQRLKRENRIDSTIKGKRSNAAVKIDKIDNGDYHIRRSMVKAGETSQNERNRALRGNVGYLHGALPKHKEKPDYNFNTEEVVIKHTTAKGHWVKRLRNGSKDKFDMVFVKD